MTPSREPRGATPIKPKRPKRTISLSLRVPRPVVVSLLAVAVIFSAGAGLRQQIKQWRITRVDVNDDLVFLNVQDVARSVLVFKGMFFFDVDVSQVRRNIFELPMVGQVTVVKRWPDTLDIRVSEKVPVAYWNQNQLLASDGSLSLKPEGFSNHSLPQFSGDAAWRETLVRSYRQAQQALAVHNISVNHLSMNTVQSLEAQLSNGWTIRFGRQFFEERLKRLNVLLLNLSGKNVHHIDLRYGKGAAIRWTDTGEHS